VKLGAGAQLDPGVVLGYQTGRKIASQDLVIGPKAKLRSGTILYAGSRIGARFETGHNVVVREECTLGDKVSVWTGSVIDYGVKLGDGVKVHTNCYVSQGSVLEQDAFLAPGVVLANDLYPGHARSAAVMRGPHIGKGAQLGCNVTVNPFVRIGAGTIVGAGSVVVKDLAPGIVAVGNPARPIKKVSDLQDERVERRAKASLSSEGKEPAEGGGSGSGSGGGSSAGAGSSSGGSSASAIASPQ